MERFCVFGTVSEKVAGAVTYDYYYDEGTLVYQEKNDNTSIHFLTEVGSEYLGFRYGGTTYFYAKNAQGDIIGILNSAGNFIARYRYDAWGVPIAITDGNGNDVSNNPSHIANINPIRYRGYYYDVETGFYYLQTRYYDPTVGRFINADARINTSQGVLGINMFAYCINNPVNMADHSGNKPGDLFDSMDEAARDFANYINGKSISNNAEYASYMYSKTVTVTRYRAEVVWGLTIGFSFSKGFYLQPYIKGFKTVSYKSKVTKYSYKEPKKGTKDSSSPPINWFGIDEKVARLHTHAAYDPAYDNDNFSPADIRNAIKQGVPTYVATPFGTLRKYNPADGSDIVLFTDMPFDSNHPSR